MSDFIEIIGRDGRRRRLRKGEGGKLADGESAVFPMAFMDIAPFADDVIRIIDAYGLPAGHRPGFLFERDYDHTVTDTASETYEARSRRMETAWRRKGEQQDADHHEDPVHDRASRPLTLDEARAAADAAREARDERLRTAWRTK